MNRVCSTRAVLLVLIALLCSSVMFGQSDLGSISGFVKDPTGAVIPNAKVTVRNPTGLERTTNTNDSGLYTITNIPPALYSITVEAPGFKKYESTNNKLDPSSTLAIDVNLAVGSATETVEVSGNRVPVANRIRGGHDGRHPPANRRARNQRPQSDQYGEPGSGRPRRQHLRSELQFQPGSLELQRFAESRKT